MMTIDDIERLTEDQVVARRNMRVGVWAGMRLGMRGDRLSAYALDVMKADDLESGPQDVVNKIASDFEESGVDFPPDLILMEIQRLERQVRREFTMTD
jgi:hypothetical protein